AVAPGLPRCGRRAHRALTPAGHVPTVTAPMPMRAEATRHGTLRPAYEADTDMGSTRSGHSAALAWLGGHPPGLGAQRRHPRVLQRSPPGTRADHRACCGARA